MKQMNRPTSWEEVPLVFDLQYACMLLGYSYDWLQRLASANKFPAHKVGGNAKGNWRCEKSEVKDWLLRR